MRPITTGIILIALLAGACGGTEEPTVMRLVGASPGLAVVTSWNLDGQRDGARTRATARLELADQTSLEVELLLAYDPAPVLAGGTWVHGDESGTVNAERVRFVGGQGEGPSVGGDYVLVDERNLPRYRVQLPLTPISRPAPRP
jgi:hypothetical protein